MKLTYDPRYNVAYIELRSDAVEVETVLVGEDSPWMSSLTAPSSGLNFSMPMTNSGATAAASLSLSTRRTAAPPRVLSPSEPASP
jgi:hypothetical protein